VALLAEGWLKLTVASRPTLNVFQLMIALLLAWLISMILPAALIAAWPDTMEPPVGRVFAVGSART